MQIITKKQFELNDETSKQLMDMAQQGIKLLTSWTTAVMELVSVCLQLTATITVSREAPLIL